MEFVQDQTSVQEKAPIALNTYKADRLPKPTRPDHRDVNQIPSFPHFVLGVFPDGETMVMEQRLEDVVPGQVMTVADDLLQPHPITKIKFRPVTAPGQPRFILMGFSKPGSLEATVIAQGVSPLQIRAFCHNLVAIAIPAMQAQQNAAPPAPPEPAPAPSVLARHGVILPGR